MAVQLYGVPVKTITTLPKRFERKFYIYPEQVGLAYGLLSQLCRKASEYPFEKINSLYFDTPDLDQYERSESGDYCKDKVRIRWYGEDDNPYGMQAVFLELKSRRGFAGIKQRVKMLVPAELLTQKHLSKGIIPVTLLTDTLSGFGYFPTGMLQSVVKISYWRHCFQEIVTGQRISLDYRIQSTMIMPGPGNGEKELELPGGVIELKGDTTEIPASLKRMEMLDTDWTRFSKYSACIDAHCERLGSIGLLSPSGKIV